MFPPATKTRRPKKNRSLIRELVRGAVDTALELATLGEATADVSHAPIHTGHPHRRPLVAPARTRRPGTVRRRAQVCTTPVHLPARH